MLIGIVISGIYGLMIGSFINALVWRLHQREAREEKGASRKPSVEPRVSVWKGRSACPGCQHQLAAKDLVPVLSWLALKGKCRYCHKPISHQYPIVEALTAGLFVLSYLALRPVGFELWLQFGFWLYILTILIALAVYDWRWLILPDRWLLPALALSLSYIVVMAALGDLNPWSHLLAGLAAGGSFYGLVAVSHGRWMGGGDIKLAALMGLLLGWANLALAMLIAFNSAALIGLLLIGLKLKTRRDYIPFGPFLCLGTVIAFIYGQTFIGWYSALSRLTY